MEKKHGSSHSHSHSHGHSHAHSHSVGDGTATQRLRLAFVLNFVFAIFELWGGFYTNSMAIMSDALHDFGDSLALLVALFLEKVSTKKVSHDFSYGYRRYSVLGALITGVVLIFGAGLIIYQSIPRILHPEATNASGMIVFALLGLAVNGYAAFRVSKGSSLNERMVMLHLIEDVVGWLFVLIGGVVMKFYDLPIIDPILGLILALWVLYNAFKNLKEAVRVFLQAVPDFINVEEIEKEILKSHSQILGIHHSHIWSLDGAQHIFTTHLVVPSQTTLQEIELLKNSIKKSLKAMSVIEATLEFEAEGGDCFDPIHD